MAILVIGVRRRCYKAAADLGKEVLLWSDGPLHRARKKHLQGWLEVPFAECRQALTEDVKRFLSDHAIERVIATTEAAVVLGARARLFLGLETLAVDVIERFHNKIAMKNIARSGGIPITNYEPIGPETTADDLVSKLGLPVVIKPVEESGALGVQVCRTVDQV